MTRGKELRARVEDALGGQPRGVSDIRTYIADNYGMDYSEDLIMKTLDRAISQGSLARVDNAGHPCYALALPSVAVKVEVGEASEEDTDLEENNPDPDMPQHEDDDVGEAEEEGDNQDPAMPQDVDDEEEEEIRRGQDGQTPVGVTNRGTTTFGIPIQVEVAIQELEREGRNASHIAIIKKIPELYDISDSFHTKRVKQYLAAAGDTRLLMCDGNRRGFQGTFRLRRPGDPPTRGLHYYNWHYSTIASPLKRLKK